MAKLGKYDIHASTYIVDDKWQYNTPTMGMKHNREHRIPIIYTLPTAASSMMSGYIGAAMAILDGTLQAALSPLDHDSDFIYYTALMSGGPGSAPDFQPRLHRFCSTDLSTSDKAVQNLVDHIQGNAAKKQFPWSDSKSMTRAFLGLYENALQRFKAILAAKPPVEPPTPTGGSPTRQIPILTASTSANLTRS